MTLPKFPSHAEAVRAGWFSRRHETDEANRDARVKYRNERSAQARRERAYARGAERPRGEAA